jgi:rare lipoprotein A
MVSLVGFTYMSENKKNSESVESSTTTVNNEEVSLMNTSLVDYVDKGMMRASWYGPKFHGKTTANGERFDQMALTAAHKKLKFGTLLRITNPKNDKSVIVRINDRGPYIPGRQLDLSKAAAQKLGMIKKGVVKLKVEEITLKGINFPVISLN